MTLLPVEHIDADVAVLGAGFAGSLTAMALARRGRRVVLIERGGHPRFAIGESSTPLANLLLEEVADRYELPRIRAFSKWGTWQRTHPGVAAGLKRGFSFFCHDGDGSRFADGSDHGRQLLVAASPHDEVADTHWYRSDLDAAFVREAQSHGVVYVDETVVVSVEDEGWRMRLDATRRGRALRVVASFVVDASGPRGCLHQLLHLPERPLAWLPPTCGIYTHFEGVDLWERQEQAPGRPPFPPDAAALHHVFPDGWIWVLRFNNGVTSAGAALTKEHADRIGGRDAQATWTALLDRLPSVKDQFRGSRPIRPFTLAPTLAFRSDVVCGERWALLPSAVGVIDPLLSTGFPLTLLGIGRVLSILEETSGGEERDVALRHYATTTQADLDITEQLVAALYETMADPAVFKRLSLLYFAAASFSEAARRAGRADAAPGFLLREHEVFGRSLRACLTGALRRGTGWRARLLERVDEAIAPIDIAGLGRRERRDWYPCEADDLLDGASRLGVTRAEVGALLERTGFTVDSR